MSCPGNPFDGHTLEGQLEKVERITGQIPAITFVDKGCKGHGVDPARSQVLISRTRKFSKMLKRDLRRRAAIEPELGQIKSDGLLGRNYLKGVLGDMQNIILCGAGHNIRKILAHLRVLLRLLTGEARKAISVLIAVLEPQASPWLLHIRLIRQEGFLRADGSKVIVVLSPGFGDSPGLLDASEPMLVETFVPEAPVEALKGAVLHRLPRLDGVVSGLGLLAPLVEHLAGELRAVVRDDGLRPAPLVDDPV